MDSNQKKFGIYVFLSTFSRNLIEVYIPVILYKNGYSIRELLVYFFIVNATSLILSYPSVYISKKMDNKLLAFVGIVAFLILQILLNFMTYNIFYLILIAVVFAIYRRGYWISRRYYNLRAIKKDKISSTNSIISVINQIGVIVSAYIGGIILDYISLKTLTIIAVLLFLSSLIPLFHIQYNHKSDNIELSLRNTFKQIPKKNIYLFGSYELINVVKFIIPLYIYIYVQNTYQAIGIVSLFTNASLILFTILYGKKLDKVKTSYLAISIILTVLAYVLKVNTVGYMLFLVSFAGGMADKMYELSIGKIYYTASKKFEYFNYNLAYEIIQNSFRSIMVLILYVINCDLKSMTYITLLFILIGIFIKDKNQLDANHLAE